MKKSRGIKQNIQKNGYLWDEKEGDRVERSSGQNTEEVPKVTVMFTLKNWFWVHAFCCIILYSLYLLCKYFYLLNFITTIWKTYPI